MCKEIFKPLNTGWIDEHAACVRDWIANIFFYTKNGTIIMIDAGYNYDRLAEKFPESRFVFDTVNERGFKMMMKVVLKNWDMKEAAAYFRTNDAVKELSLWSDRIKVSTRGYMLGYYEGYNIKNLSESKEDYYAVHYQSL